jgi:hypothetical protein
MTPQIQSTTGDSVCIKFVVLNTKHSLLWLAFALFIQAVPLSRLLILLLLLFWILLYSGTHVTLESLIKDNELKSTIKGLVKGSGRSHPVGENEVQAKEESAATTAQTQQVATGKEKLLVTQLNGVPQKEISAV